MQLFKLEVDYQVVAQQVYISHLELKLKNIKVRMIIHTLLNVLFAARSLRGNIMIQS